MAEFKSEKWKWEMARKQALKEGRGYHKPLHDPKGKTYVVRETYVDPETGRIRTKWYKPKRGKGGGGGGRIRDPYDPISRHGPPKKTILK